MKGQYEGRQPGATDGGERVLVWATVLKTHDVSNLVVSCCGELFTPSAEAMSAAEPTSEELRQATTNMVAWERKDAERVREETAAAKAEADARERVAAAADAGGMIDRVKAAVVSALTSGAKGAQAP